MVLEIFRVNGQLLAEGDRLSKQEGLTSARWQVIGALRIADEPLTVAQIARNMGLTRQSVQRIVDLLSLDGLIEMQPNPRHKRARLALLTEDGRTLAERMSVIQREWADSLAHQCDEAELLAALDVLTRLQVALDKRQADDI